MSYSVIIVHFKDVDGLNRLVSSISNWSSKPAKILVADNSARDIGPALLSFSPVPIELHPQKDNLGYGAAVNNCLKLMGDSGDLVLILTQDVALESKCAEKLLFALDQNTAAIAAPLLFESNKPRKLFSSGGVLTKWGITRHQKKSKSPDENPIQIDWADGACMMVRADAIRDVGGFDPSFFLYVEDVDLQLRLKLAGHDVLIVPGAKAWQSPGNYTDFFRYRNHIYLTRKHRGYLKPWPWQVFIAVDFMRFLLLGRKFDFRGAWRGIREGKRMPPRLPGQELID